ncbi:tetratricopeptide repeat protein [Candidatus Chlorohelix sp.]|uniref:tetratricopeptide repeat protein n=1 Tax=Candidatus Chlorohelix sp. TaxID=3139201 RepID=UPI003031835D
MSDKQGVSSKSSHPHFTDEIIFIELKHDVANRMELPQLVPLFQKDYETEITHGQLPPAAIAAAIEALKLVKPALTEYDRFLARYYLLEAHRSLEQKPPDGYQAQRYFQKALGLDVGEPSAEAAFYLGNMLSAVDTLEAERMYRLSLDIQPGVATVHYELGLLLRARRDLPNALGEFEKAFRLEPDNAILLNEVAETQLMAENYEQARAAFARAAEIEPENWIFPVKLGLAEYRLGEYAFAMTHLRAGLDESPDELLDGETQSLYIDGLFCLGLAYRATGDPVRARKLFKAVLNIAPGFEPAVLALNG